MIPRPDFEHACDSCGAAVECGETECRRCRAYAALASLSEVARRMMDCATNADDQHSDGAA